MQLEHLKLKPTELVFLCRKAIGYFFLHPVTAASVLVAVLRIATDEVADNVELLLAEPLLLNYGGDIREYLKSIDASDPAATRVQSALTRNESFLQAIRNIPNSRNCNHLNMNDK